MNDTDFRCLLTETQEYISKYYSTIINDSDRLSQLKLYIEKHLRDLECESYGYKLDELTDKIYSEMAEYSILTKYLKSDDLEEININSWDDIAVTHINGRTEKINEHFYTPQHAVDIVKRLLQHSGMVIDNSMPLAYGYLNHHTGKNGLSSNTRITAIKEPVVDERCGISASIRFLQPQRINCYELVKSEFATKEMIDFLCMCIRFGVCLVITGATSSGKTTLLNALLQSIPDNKRIFSIESGSRELSLIKHDENNIANNVIHTLSRPNSNPDFNISQEDLVAASLRFNPDIIAVGEMRDTEAYSAVEASLTGHTVVSTVHSGSGSSAHMRIALLCQKRFPIDFNTSLMQASQAFPIIVHTHKLENNIRKIMDISECEFLPDGGRIYHTLFRYNIDKNIVVKGTALIEGYFAKINKISESLRLKLMQYGAPQNQLINYI